MQSQLVASGAWMLLSPNGVPGGSLRDTGGLKNGDSEEEMLAERRFSSALE